MKPNLFPDTYKVDQCKDCGIIRLHVYKCRQYLKVYIAGGKYCDNRPECK
ncbi:hypothetical protein M2132_001797 [Dysgonomonas sp. PH5-45]|nr:hypothetical protein [Dysgonomonas sp. PH5-45]